MIVYHGSDVVVDHPGVDYSFRNLDFGKGFYVTTVREQAERWARRKADYTKGTAILNIYSMEEPEGFRVLDFGENTEDWIDFVCDCRDGKQGYRDYDVIIGKVANDKVFRVVDMYHMGIWDKERAIKEMRVYPTYDQIAFVAQEAIDGLLRFQEAMEVSYDR